MRISDCSSDVCSSDLKDRWSAVIEEQPVHLATGFHEPESDRVIDCGVAAPPDFTPERTAQANVYEAVAAHIAELRKARQRFVLASYSKGSRARLDRKSTRLHSSH